MHKNSVMNDRLFLKFPLIYHYEYFEFSHFISTEFPQLSDKTAGISQIFLSFLYIV